MKYPLIKQIIQIVSLLLIMSSMAHATLYCRSNSGDDIKLAPKDRFCFRGQSMIFDVDGDKRVDDSEREQACSSGHVDLGTCGSLIDQGRINERCLIGHIKVCRYCDLKDQDNILALEGHVDTSMMSAKQYCNARNNTPENFDKVVYTREDFHRYRLNPLKKKFVDIVYGFSSLQQMMEQSYAGQITSMDPYMNIPRITYPDGKSFSYDIDEPTEGDFIEDPENPQKPNMTDEWVPYIAMPAETELGYRRGFKKNTDFNFSEKNQSGESHDVNKEFQAAMYNWLDHTQEAIMGEGGLLELLDNMGTSDSVAWARDHVASLNQNFKTWQALSYGLNPDNYLEWQAGLEELKLGYSLVYGGHDPFDKSEVESISTSPTPTPNSGGADRNIKNDNTPIEDFYFRPQTSAN